MVVEGDFGRRLRLRKGDFLKDVAAAAGTVARTMEADRARTDALVAAVSAALDRGDVTDATLARAFAESRARE